MESPSTTVEEIRFRERTRMRDPQDETGAVEKEAQARAKNRLSDEAQAENRLSMVEKASFGIATVFSAGILVVAVSLMIMGFIFSPITHTLMFGVLAAATGTTSYVIWRGGKCRRQGS